MFFLLHKHLFTVAARRRLAVTCEHKRVCNPHKSPAKEVRVQRRSLTSCSNEAYAVFIRPLCEPSPHKKWS